MGREMDLQLDSDRCHPMEEENEPQLDSDWCYPMEEEEEEEEEVEVEVEVEVEEEEEEEVEAEAEAQIDPKSNSRKRCLDLFSDMAIKDYNDRHENAPFRVEQALSFSSFYHSETNGYIIHLSFVGENIQTKILKLFFAIIDADDKVKTCTVVEPGNPLFGAGCFFCHPAGTIYHSCLDSSGEYKGQRYHLGPYEEAAKELFDNAYSIESSVQNFDTEDADKLKKAYDEYARMALTEYRYNERETFKHLESVSGVRFHYDVNPCVGSFWVHLIFKAKNEDPNRADDPPVYFFAEVCLDSDWGPVTCVAIIPDPNFGSLRDKKSCKAFKHCLVHPPDCLAADCEKGYFADSLCNGQCKGVKSELLRKDDADSNNAQCYYNEVMRREPRIYD